jgi:hypothetical protein
METTRLAVTLTNGRSHAIDLPEGIAAEDAAAVLRGARTGSEIGWPDGDAEWISFGNGQGWVRRETIAELALVEYFPDEPAYGSQVYD